MAISPIQFVSAGEMLVDLISSEPRVPLAQVKRFEKHFGGSPANVAVNLHRLGIPSTIVSKVGHDSLGDFLVEQLSLYGIDTTHVGRDRNFPTSAVVVSSGVATADFVIYRQADTQLTREMIPNTLLQQARIFHTTAHGIARNPTREAILDAFRFAHENGIITSFDPNYSDRYWPDREDAMQTLRHFFSLATFTKPSEDDAERIFGPGLSDDQAIDRFHELGAKNVILTKGAKGSRLSLEGGLRRDFPAEPLTRVVDATGAGDAFTAGFYAAYLTTNDPIQSMGVGAKTAAFKLGYLGAISPLPPLARFL